MTTTSVDASAIAWQIVTLARDEPAVEAMYCRHGEEYPEFWILTKPVDLNVERRIRHIQQKIYELHPDALFEFHVLNPRLSQNFDPSVFIPSDAAKLFMR